MKVEWRQSEINEMLQKHNEGVSIKRLLHFTIQIAACMRRGVVIRHLIDYKNYCDATQMLRYHFSITIVYAILRFSESKWHRSRALFSLIILWYTSLRKERSRQAFHENPPSISKVSGVLSHNPVCASRKYFTCSLLYFIFCSSHVLASSSHYEKGNCSSKYSLMLIELQDLYMYT